MSKKSILMTAGKTIAHTTLALYLVSGIALVFVGKWLWDTGISGDGVAPLFMLMGVATGVLGLITAGYATVIWAFGTAAQIFGLRKVIGALGVLLLCVFVADYFTSDDANDLDTDNLDTEIHIPVAVGEFEESTVHAEPDPNSAIIDTLSAETDLTILEVLDIEQNGYPWFRISDGVGGEGYVWGGRLCALDTWVNGLFDRCKSARRSEDLESFEWRGSKDPTIDTIEMAYRILPGCWANSLTPGSCRFHLGSNREFRWGSETREVRGYWSVSIPPEYPSHLRLLIHYKEGISEKPKWGINFLSHDTIHVKANFDKITYLRVE